jgi:hypothetical protein
LGLPCARVPCLGAIALLALAGCAATSAQSTLTKGQFTARADAICRNEEAKLQRAAALDHASIASIGEVRQLTRQAAAIHEEATFKLESLPQPRGEAATIRSWLTARTVAATLEHDTAEAPPGRGSTAARDIREALARASTSVQALSRLYGFEVCGGTE